MTLRRSWVTNCGVGRLAEIQPDRPVRFFPAVAVVEVEARRQFVAAHRSQRVLVHRQHARAEVRPPNMGVEESRMAVRLQHERRQEQDQVARGHDEIVNDPQRPGIDEVYLDQPSAPVDAVEQQRRARSGYEADVPERAVRLHLRMGRRTAGRRHPGARPRTLPPRGFRDRPPARIRLPTAPSGVPPWASMEVFAAFMSSGPVSDPVPGVPKAGMTRLPARVSRRRLGVSRMRPRWVARPSAKA